MKGEREFHMGLNSIVFLSEPLETVPWFFQQMVLAIAYVPVSYTHLDVYKRQLQYNHWKYRCSRGKWRGSPSAPEFLELHKGKCEKGHKFSFSFKINVKKM